MNESGFGRPTKAIINLTQYRNNIKAIQEYTKKPILAVVKSNAYGHGLIPMAAQVEDIVDYYGVAISEEAVTLRSAGIMKPILVLGYTNPLDIDLVTEKRIRVTIHSLEQWLEWKEQLKKRKNTAEELLVHIKINTGMNRLGFKTKEEFIQIYEEIRGAEGIQVEGVFTHFATADAVDDPLIAIQEKKFKQLLEGIDTSNLIVHMANSAYTLCEERDTLCDMVRIGISSYGMLPDHNAKPMVETAPIMELKTAIVSIQKLKAGETVGYGASFKAETNERVGIIPIGYGDGILRSYAKNAYVLVNGERREFAGDRNCMDQSMIILKEKDQLGDEVVIYGKQGDQEITFEMAGDWADTINYELSCALSDRVRREYVY